MPTERDRLRLTDDEAAAFLHEHFRAMVGSNHPSGWPHVVPMSYFLVDGDVALWTDPASQKVQNLRRDPRATVLVEDGTTAADYRAVQIRGRVEIVESESRSIE